MENNFKVTLNLEKVGKSTCTFAEPVANEFIPERIGKIYVSKSILAENGYTGKPITVTVTNGENPDGIRMKLEKVTANTIKFAEVLENEFCLPIIGSLYLPKWSMAEIAYNGGDIAVEIDFEK